MKPTRSWYELEPIPLRSPFNLKGAFTTAVEKNDGPAVRRIIGSVPKDRMTEFLKMGPGGLTFLLLAAQRTSEEALQIILKTDAAGLVNVPYPEDGSTLLMYACRWNEHWLVRQLLTIPELRVNQRDARGDTALHYACRQSRDECLRLLLTHPRIKVNRVNELGSPALAECYSTDTNRLQERCLRRMLSDPRVDPNIVNNAGHSILFSWMGPEDKALKAITYLLASDHDIGFEDAEYSRASQFPEIINLLENYGRILWDPDDEDDLDEEDVDYPTIHEFRADLRKELDWYPNQAEVYADAVLLNDRYTEIIKNEKGTAAGRFWRIMLRLPKELQMILANRQAGSMADSIPFRDSERAFNLLLDRFAAEDEDEEEDEEE